ncbi:MAG: Gfo/Idh/MocA family oxidoreductase [Anaerolineales bacterium]|nr:Gfo/Idh/MocA family oxidoreductase [Anaerolineales bacterium]
MKFLIAGYGSIGKRHFNNLRALGVKDFVFLRSNNSTLDLSELADYPVEHSIEAALAHKPDAVVVSNPTALHLDVAIPAAAQGCSLLMEKPISHSLERVAQLQATAAAGGSRILVGFQWRFHPTLQKAVELLQSGQMGRVLSARAHWGEYLPNWHPYEDYRKGYSARADLGGGVMLTLCHPFDYLRWLLGDVRSVWASLAHSGELEIAVEDQAEVGLEFASGALASVHLDYVQQPPSHTLQIVCSEGRLEWNAATGTLVQTQANGEQREFSPEAGFERNQLFIDQTRHFLEVAHGSAQPLCTLEDGVRALEIALAAHTSHAQGARISVGAA